jgi:hypothetical protein
VIYNVITSLPNGIPLLLVMAYRIFLSLDKCMALLPRNLKFGFYLADLSSYSPATLSPFCFNLVISLGADHKDHTVGINNNRTRINFYKFILEIIVTINTNV